jgi:hypothetical protein
MVAAGVNDCEIARRLGVARTTVRDWREPRYVPKRAEAALQTCPRCWTASRPITCTPADYAELLGLYLGDGYISHGPRTQRLRIYLDARYTVVVNEAEALLRRCFPANQVGRVLGKDGTMIVLSNYHRHLACLFPQHGPGKKHERRIVLESWQQAIVTAEPWSFLRGCIRSDGCAFINRTGRYEYLSYHFGNLSSDIRDLFVSTCAQVGVHCCVSGKHVPINRRACVAQFEEHVGLKL